MKSIWGGGTIDTDGAERKEGTVSAAEFDVSVLVPQENAPVRVTERIAPKRIFTDPAGNHLVDFGQNLTGLVEIKVKGKKGQKIAIRHAETLDQNGVFYPDTLRTAISRDTYILNGDVRILEESWQCMHEWVDYIHNRVNEHGLWMTNYQYGDWPALDREQGDGSVGATDVYLVANACYIYVTDLVAKTARVLGKETEALHYEKLHQKTLESFREEYYTARGRIVSETQTGCVLSLHFDLAKEKDRGKILNALLSNIENHKNHLTTGFVGTPYGSIGDWMYRKIGGINQLEAGYRRFYVKPMFVRGIEEARTRIIFRRFSIWKDCAGRLFRIRPASRPGLEEVPDLIRNWKRRSRRS